MKKKNISDFEILLGSNSPRRKELLHSLYIPYKITDIHYDESFPSSLKKGKITEFIALNKANAYKKKLDSNQILITGDTIVWNNNEQIGKPKSVEQAIFILKNLSERKHIVYSSCCVKTNHKTYIISDKTYVYFSKLKKEEIAFYVNKEKPFDKAGSYGIQDWIGLAKIKKIKGNYNTVLGLPTHKLYNQLRTFIDFKQN